MLRVLYLLLFAAVGLLSQGCASSGGETLKIDLQHVVGRQYMPDELTVMLRKLGYDWIPIFDPNTQFEVKTVQQDGEYRMHFEYVQTRQVRIDARIKVKSGFTRLHFYEPTSQTLSATSRELLQKLKKRVVLEFGETNVTY